MIAFAPCKINIGLKILGKRGDGFHNLDSFLYPVPFYDIIEIHESKKDELLQTGLISTQDLEENLVYKSLCKLRVHYKIPPLKIHLHKQIPFQAGLGGGSSDAVAMLKLLNKAYDLNINKEKMYDLASELGSDCAFFVESQASRISGRGDQVYPIDLSLKGKFIVIVKPPFSVSTAQAFQEIKLENRDLLPNLNEIDLENWKEIFTNDFQAFTQNKYPETSNIIKTFHDHGAFYTSMSGSGSAVFGLFHFPVKIKFDKSFFNWTGQLQ